MRKILTGVDDDGRSCVVEVVPLGDADQEVAITPLFATDQAVPPARPTGHGEDMDIGVPPGHTTWMIVKWPPDQSAFMHHTDTIDYNLVLDGSITLILDDGEHELGPGDCVVVTGVDHSWRSGPEGCTQSVVLLGSEPPGHA